MSSSVLSAAVLVIVAIMHSVLGERRILVPLMAGEWSLPLSRPIAERIIRYAWHLTSATFVGLAAVTAGVGAGVVVGLLSLTAAVILFVTVRTHPAWPLFGLVGFAALDSDGILPAWTRTTGGLIATAGLAFAAGLHWYWVGGGNWLADRAIPTLPDAAADHRGPGRLPGRLATAAVAVGLMILAAITATSAVSLDLDWIRFLGWIGVAVFVGRSVGDGRFVGFTKTVRSTPFARADDRYFTPSIVLLALGMAGGLLAPV